MSIFDFRKLLFAALVASGSIGKISADSLEKDLHEAIDKGTDFLLKAVEKNQSEGDPREGRIALETYALIVAGVSVDHQLIKKNLGVLGKMQLEHTYTVSCYALLLDAAISQIQNDQQFLGNREVADPVVVSGHLDKLEKAVQALLHIKQPNIGAWNYGPEVDRYDHSNTQFAVLALGAGAKRRISIPDSAWEEIARHFINTQTSEGPEVQGRVERYPQEDQQGGKNIKIKIIDKSKDSKKDEKEEVEKKEGEDKKEKTGVRQKTTVGIKPVPEVGEEGIKVYARRWRYNPEHDTNAWNMTCAGLSSAILAADNLKGKVPGDFQTLLNKAIRDGYGWVMQNWTPTGGSYYGIYSLEKVADLNEIKKFAGHDWYDEVARHLVQSQSRDGSWSAGAGTPAQVRENTAFALLVLNRATTLLLEARRSISERIAITGVPKGVEKVAQDWVYIQSLDRELHIPSIFRLLRLRPHQKVLNFVLMIIQDYPHEKKALLVPPILRAYQETPHKGIQKALRDQLSQIAGASYEKIEDYSKWLRRWQDADEIGTLVKKTEIPTLLRYYQHTSKSLPLREKIIWALTRCQAREAIPLLVDDLEHAEPSVRQAAYIAIQSLPLKEPPPPFSAKAAAGDREKQLKAVQDWFERIK